MIWTEPARRPRKCMKCEAVIARGENCLVTEGSIGNKRSYCDECVISVVSKMIGRGYWIKHKA